MLAKLAQSAAPADGAELKDARHVVFVLPKTSKLEGLRDVPFRDVLAAALARRKKKLDDLTASAVSTDLPQGALAAWVTLDPSHSPFEQGTALRKAMQLALGERPEQLTVAVYGSATQRRHAAELAVYAAWVNGARLPERKKKSGGAALQSVRLHGYRAPDGFSKQRAVAEGNFLCRELTVLPPNELTPGGYRKRVRQLAQRQGWRHEEYDVKRLRKMGAGAFAAVAQGSAEADAAIVHLRYRHPHANVAGPAVAIGSATPSQNRRASPSRGTFEGTHQLLVSTEVRGPGCRGPRHGHAGIVRPHSPLDGTHCGR